jgi:subtilisin family serine protease
VRGKITGRNLVRVENGVATAEDREKWYGEGDHTLHGTQIASIIGGCAFTVKGDGTDTVTVYPAGIAPDTDLYLCRAVNPVEIEDALKHLHDSKKVDVICMSLTMDLDDVEGIRNRLGELTQKDVVCIACAGNEGYIQEYPGFPAFNQNVLSVGALQSKGELSGMNPPRGSGIDVYAPGESICVPSYEKEGIMPDQGTSYSAAIVAGIILLLIQCAGTVDDDVRKMYHKLEFLKRLCASAMDNFCTNQCLRHPQRFLQRLAKDKEYIRQLIHDHYDKCVCEAQ